MTGIYKTISGALYRAPNLEHNNRDHIPWNAVSERADRNKILVNGTKDFTIEQAYDKLFQKSYENWLQKEHSKSRAKDAPPTYYEKIEQNKKKHVSYEIIWQIGDMDDTGYDTENMEAGWAEELLLDFAKHLMEEVPNVSFLTKERIADKNWKPPFEAGIVITNFAFNGDESTPHLHMTFVPYSDNCSRGQKTQNALAQTFSRMGYKTTMQQAVDVSDELVWQDTPEGKKPQMVRTSFGAVEWIEEQKNWLADYMEKEIGWRRLFKGKNERGDLLLSDYRRERAAEKALEAEKERERNELALEAVKKDAEEQLKQYDSQINSRELRLTLTDTMLEQKQKDLEELDVRAEQIKLECSEADEKLTDKKKEVESAQFELNNLETAKAEAEERRRVAEEVRAEIVAGADYGDLVDKVVNLTYENQKLQEENRGLRHKLNEAYEFMKQFVINGRNMLEVFRERIGEVKEWVRRKVAG